MLHELRIKLAKKSYAIYGFHEEVTWFFFQKATEVTIIFNDIIKLYSYVLFLPFVEISMLSKNYPGGIAAE